MRREIYFVDAFTDNVFSGNPAAVCPLETWLPDDMMQNIAAENNLSETAFFVPEGEGYRIRWFTPTVEVKLCGHATLASGHVLFNHREFSGVQVKFESLSGPLSVSMEADIYYLDFPSRPAETCPIPDTLIPALGGCEPMIVLASQYYLVVYESEDVVRDMKPDFDTLRNLDKPVIVTSAGSESDFVSRFFAPGFGIPEDPVTGSSHTTLIPYWSKRLQKQEMTAFQVSKRGGKLYCRNEGDRVKIGGQAVTYMTGTISV